MTPQQYKEQNMKGFEGDSFLHEEIKSLVSKHGIDQIIETGTYLGWTTRKFAEMAQTLTSEINPQYFKEAVANIGQNNKVIMYLGNSVDCLKQYLPGAKDKKILMWHDAHWANDCPLLDELQVIADNGILPIICIHDFKVEGRPDLGFDSYNGQDFTLEWVNPKLDLIYGARGFTYYFNSEATGAKRGVLFCLPNE